MAPSAVLLHEFPAAYGVLKVTLHASSLDYQFMPAGTATFTDSGSIACH